MNKPKSIGEQRLTAEIVRALSYLEGRDVSAEEKRQIAETPTFQLTREAQFLREAVMLRQQREAAEYVRDSIRASKATGSPETGLPPS